MLTSFPSCVYTELKVDVLKEWPRIMYKWYNYAQSGMDEVLTHLWPEFILKALGSTCLQIYNDTLKNYL